MLAQLDEYRPVLLQSAKRAFGASKMARLELFIVIWLVVALEYMAVAVQKRVALATDFLGSHRGYRIPWNILSYVQYQRRNYPVTPLRSYVDVSGIFIEGHGCCANDESASYQDQLSPSLTALCIPPHSFGSSIRSRTFTCKCPLRANASRKTIVSITRAPLLP